MTLPMPTDPEELQAILRAREDRDIPNLTIVRHAGWRLVNTSIIQNRKSEDDYQIRWLAANSVTGEIVTFKIQNDEPEACFESAADYLVTTSVKYLP